MKMVVVIRIVVEEMTIVVLVDVTEFFLSPVFVYVKKESLGYFFYSQRNALFLYPSFISCFFLSLLTSYVPGDRDTYLLSRRGTAAMRLTWNG